MKVSLLPILVSFLVFIPVYRALANEPPQASFSYFPAHPDTLDVVQFLDTSSDPDGAIVSWYWDFGDGESATIQNPSHRYARPGSFVVSLTVTDNEGASAIYSTSITVVQPPAPKKSRFRFHMGMMPQTTSWESGQFDFDLEAYLDLTATWDKAAFSLEGIVGVAGPELAVFGIESPIGLLMVRDQFVFAAPFIECSLGTACHPIGPVLFAKKRASVEFALSGLTLSNLMIFEDANFPIPQAVPAPPSTTTCSWTANVLTVAAGGACTYTAGLHYMPVDPATGEEASTLITTTGDCALTWEPGTITITNTGMAPCTATWPTGVFYDASYTTGEQAFLFGDIFTLKATTIGKVRVTSILGLCADPQLTNLLKKKSFPGRVCAGSLGFTVEKILIEDLSIGGVRIDSETEFRLQEPVEETLELFYPLAGLGDLTAVLATEDILSFALERAILKLRSGPFTLSTVLDQTLSISSSSLILSLRPYENLGLFATATFLPTTGLSSFTLYALIQLGKEARFTTLTIFSAGAWASSTFTISMSLMGLELDLVARFLSTGLEGVTLDLGLMF
jgi:PKD repeat protein